LLQYWRSVFARAFWDSLKSFDTSIELLGLGLLGAVLTAVLVRLIRGKQAFREHVIANIAIAFAGAILTWSLVFGWHLAHAPFLVQGDSIRHARAEQKNTDDQQLRTQLAVKDSKIEAQGHEISALRSAPPRVIYRKPEVAEDDSKQREAERKRKAEIRTHLGILLGEATAIKTFCVAEPPPSPKFSCVDSANDWARRTIIYIGNNLEQSYQPRFLAATGYRSTYDRAKTPEINNAMDYLTFKAAILEQFIKEFKD
jgi:hypothetical protein